MRARTLRRLHPSCSRSAHARGKATVKDVARAAGVSITTVSRVLNNPELVASDKQDAVQRALRASITFPTSWRAR